MKLFLAATLTAAATAAAPLHPGQWEVTSTPGVATLNGRALGDLPYTPPAEPDRVCLSNAQARDPEALVVSHVPAGCSIRQRARAGASLKLSGSCTPQAAGLASGSFRLVGRWSADRWQVEFETTNPSENGRMGFSGRVAGRRVGPCPG